MSAGIVKSTAVSPQTIGNEGGVTNYGSERKRPDAAEATKRLNHSVTNITKRFSQLFGDSTSRLHSTEFIQGQASIGIECHEVAAQLPHFRERKDAFDLQTRT